jgi:alkylation response protein AidB-like acyl-CoA dehydrogenase
MDFAFSPEDEAFRAELRDWLAANLPKDEPRREPFRQREDIEALKVWQRKLYDGEWAAITWPREWGGREATLTQVFIYQQEMALARAPVTVNSIGIFNIGPMLLAHGTEEQKQRWLPPMLRAEEIWCQGFSEPNAGSDLAALQTRAIATEDGFVVNGQKIWTSFAHYSKWCLALVRTDPSSPKHKGISALVIDMESPGVEVRPIKEISGDSGFNEIFFTDAHVPGDHLVGAVNRGWDVAITTLAHERMGTTTLTIQMRQQLDDAIAVVRSAGAIEDPLIRQRLVQLHTEVELARLLALRALTKALKGTPPTTEVALGKLAWSYLSQDIAELAVEVQGVRAPLWRGSPGLADGGRWQQSLVYSRMTTIGAGTTEIQKNILAERALGLPRGS